MPIATDLVPLFLVTTLRLLKSVLDFEDRHFFGLVSKQPGAIVLGNGVSRGTLHALQLATTSLVRTLHNGSIFSPQSISCTIIRAGNDLSITLHPRGRPTALTSLKTEMRQTRTAVPFILSNRILTRGLAAYNGSTT